MTPTNVMYFPLLFGLTVFAKATANELDPIFIAKKWAPEVRLAKGEQWRPSSVDFFLEHVNLQGGSSVSTVNISNLPGCNDKCYLQTKVGLDCNSCTNVPVFRGQDPSNVPAYAMYEVNNLEISITYLFFYPYNRGKKVCVGLYDSKGFWFVKPLGCIGVYSTFGHHVGDWEDIKITLQRKGNRYVPVKLWVSAHEFGHDYFWNAGKFVRGKDNVTLVENTHPLVYSASGSHGLWPSAGNHRYHNLSNGHFLEDSCSDGFRWKIWKKLKIVRKGDYNGEFNFFGFKGRWGNQKRGCFIVESVSGQCTLNSGPKTPK